MHEDDLYDIGLKVLTKHIKAFIDFEKIKSNSVDRIHKLKLIEIENKIRDVEVEISKITLLLANLSKDHMNGEITHKEFYYPSKVC